MALVGTMGVGLISTSASSGTEAALRKSMEAVRSAGAPGVVVLVRSGRRSVRLARGFGDTARRTPIRVTDRFRIGSLTKTFVATTTLQLIGEKRLALDDSVERWVPGLIPNGSSITIRQLLNHTSGIFDFWKDEEFFRRLVRNPTQKWPAKKLIKIATSHGPQFAPGTRYVYSNTNYVVLGLIVEQATGSSIGKELAQHIFTPVGLARTTYPSSPEISGPHAHGYLVLDKPPAEDVTLIHPSAAGAAGGILSTADDIARFYRALLGGRLLRPELMEAMKTTIDTGQGFRYGLGLAAIPTPCGTTWGHRGDLAGYTAVAVNSPDGRRQVVVLFNTMFEDEKGEKAVQHLISTAYCD